jgi:hypothetical protein
LDQQLARDGVRRRVVTGEDQRALLGVEREQLTERRAFAARVRQDRAIRSPRRQRVAAGAGLPRVAHELLPRGAARGAHVRRVDGREARAMFAIERALVASEPDRHGDELVFGERVAGEVVDGQAVHDGANEARESLAHLGLGGWRRGEAEPARCDEHLEHLGGAHGAEVVRFVDDDEPEAVADARGPRDRGGERGHGDRSDIVVTVAESADREAPHGRERACPLIEEHARRHEDQRGHRELGDRGDRGERLAGAGGKCEHAATARGFPRCEGFVLIPAQLGQ